MCIRPLTWNYGHRCIVVLFFRNCCVFDDPFVTKSTKTPCENNIYWHVYVYRSIYTSLGIFRTDYRSKGLITNDYVKHKYIIPCYELWREKTYLLTCAFNEDSDQPVHLRSLIRIFIGHFLDSWWCKVSLYWQCRLWLDYGDVQTDLSVKAHVRSYIFLCYVSYTSWRLGLLESNLFLTVICVIKIEKKLGRELACDA